MGRVAAVLGIAGLLLLPPAVAAQAPEYDFTKVADSAEEGFDPFSFGCVGINGPGDVVFRTAKIASDGVNTVPGIFRADSGGRLTTIVQDRDRFGFISNNPSMNNRGDVSFAANIERGNEEGIFRGDGGPLTRIATTRGKFNFFGFDTSINDRRKVAFKAELDASRDFAEGLFSGGPARVRTHYLNSRDVLVDGSPARFGGNDSRPSINDRGRIAFDEGVEPTLDPGIFVGRDGVFETIASPDPERSVGAPVLNNEGTAAFETSFTQDEEFVTAIVTGDGGPLVTVADTTGPFSSFGFRPPALNDGGGVAFDATLDDFETSGIFVGPDADADRVIATGDTLDGETVSSLTFCEEGLNDEGELAFLAGFEDVSAPKGSRVAVYRASPRL